MPFDIAQLADVARATLHRLLAQIPNHRRTPKPLSLGLVLDQRLKSAVSLVTDVPSLRAEGVEKFYQLLPSKLDSPCTTLAYVIRAKPSVTRLVASQIRSFATTHPQRALFVFFLPSATPLCQRILEEEGVYGNIAQVGDCDIDLLPFDRDVLSLENELSFPECAFDEDFSSLHSVAASLIKIQQQLGKFHFVAGKGQCSRLVWDIFLKLQAIQSVSAIPPAARTASAPPQPTFVSTSKEKSNEPSPQIDHVILLDRTVDLITPCVTQLTYEGLIDEIFGIQNNAIEIDASIIKAGEKGTKTKMVLNSSDAIYTDLRYRNFAAVPPLLNAKAKILSESLKDKPNANTPLAEIRSFLLRLSPTQSDLACLQRHIYLSEHIASLVSDDSFHKHLQIEQELLAGNRTESTDDYIEQCIDKREPFARVLRLVSLRSHTCGGYSNKRYAWLKKELLQTYGYEHMLSLPRLESVGLLREKDGKDNFPALKRGFRLLVPEVNETDPNDVAYVYSGYAPLSIRVLQAALRPGGWRAPLVDESLRLLPGPAFGDIMPAKPIEPGAPQRTVLVYFVGGVTFAEIEALRFLSSQPNSPFTYLVATTKIIGGDPFFNTLLEAFE